VLLRALAEAGVDMFDTSTLYFSAPAFEGSDLPLAGWVKRLVDKPSMAVGGLGLSDHLFNSFETGGAAVENNFYDAAERIDRGEFDMIALGRALIANPDWPQKLRAGRPTLPYRREMLSSLD
jgi:2,4-dienoyl-CoA reductase-like NADH-dependent reductase (Old Yellow Enzyme family)